MTRSSIRLSYTKRNRISILIQKYNKRKVGPQWGAWHVQLPRDPPTFPTPQFCRVFRTFHAGIAVLAFGRRRDVKGPASDRRLAVLGRCLVGVRPAIDWLRDGKGPALGGVRPAMGLSRCTLMDIMRTLAIIMELEHDDGQGRDWGSDKMECIKFSYPSS
jgi:hypothetical protein